MDTAAEVLQILCLELVGRAFTQLLLQIKVRVEEGEGLYRFPGHLRKEALSKRKTTIGSYTVTLSWQSGYDFLQLNNIKKHNTSTNT